MAEISVFPAGPAPIVQVAAGVTPPPKGAISADTALRAAAEALEAEFLTEMLKPAGLGQTRDAFGGGIGEEQFASFLRREQATEMTRHGGIGLAESIFNALKRRAGHAE